MLPQLSYHSPELLKLGQLGKKHIRACVFYQSIEAAKQVKSLLDRLRMSTGLNADLKLWNSYAALATDFQQITIEDEQTADIVIIAGYADTDLPLEIGDRINDWPKTSPDNSQVLVYYRHPVLACKDHSAKTAAFLRSVAERKHMAFLTNQAAVAPHPTTLQDIARRAFTITPTLAKTLGLRSAGNTAEQPQSESATHFSV